MVEDADQRENDPNDDPVPSGDALGPSCGGCLVAFFVLLFMVVVVLSTVDRDQDYAPSLGDYAAKITCGPREIQTLVIPGE